MKSIETSLFKRILALTLAIIMMVCLSPMQGIVAYAEGDEPVAGDEPTPAAPEAGDDPAPAEDPPADDPLPRIGRIEVIPSFTYDGEEHAAVVDVETLDMTAADTLQYKLSGSKETSWSGENPTVKTPGTYVVLVQIVRGGEVVAGPKQSDTIMVSPAESHLELVNSAYNPNAQGGTPVEVNLAEMPSDGFCFTAKSSNEINTGAITYTLVDSEKIASLNGQGFLTATKGGKVTIQIAQAASEGFEEATLDVTVIIKAAETEELLKFENASVEYILSNKTAPSEQQAKLTYDNDNAPTYKLEGDAGLTGLLSVDGNGKVTFSQLKNLADYLNTNGPSTVKVVAEKEARIENGVTVYPAATAEYTLTLKLDTAPNPAVILPEITTTLPSGDKVTWYNNKDGVTVRSGKTGYQLSLGASAWRDSIAIKGDGVYAEQTVYFRQVSTGNISIGKIPPMKIDTKAPKLGELNVAYDSTSAVLSMITLGKYKNSATFTVTVTDAGDEATASGVNCVQWSLVSGGAEVDGGLVKIDAFSGTASFTLSGSVVNTENLQGSIRLKAYDNAGNVADSEQGTVVIDNTAPTLENVLFNGEENKGSYNEPITITFELKDDYFDPTAPVDGSFEAAYTVGGENGSFDVSWEKTGEGVFKGTIQVGADKPGKYELTLSGKDDALNEIEPCTLSFCIDTQAPTVTITYERDPVAVITDTITLGFWDASVDVFVKAEDDLSGVESITWQYVVDERASSTASTFDTSEHTVKEGDENVTAGANGSLTVTITMEPQTFGIITASAADKAGNESEKANSDRVFVVDDLSPAVTLTVDEPDNEKDDVAYYKDEIKIQIEIEEANFAYTTTELKISKDGGEPEPVELSWSPADSLDGPFTAETVITEDGEYEFTFTCKDKSTNDAVSKDSAEGEDFAEGTYTSGKLVLDKTAPEVTLTVDHGGETPAFSKEESGEGGEKLTHEYYNTKSDKHTATITVVEHNFFAEDFVDAQVFEALDFGGDDIGESITVNEEPVLTSKLKEHLQDKANWMKSGDTYTVSIVFNAEANYSIGLGEYQDRATNEAKVNGAGAMFTYDYTAPTVEVTYTKPVRDDKTIAYYKSELEIKLVVTDTISGVASASMNYKMQDGVSPINQKSFASPEEQVITPDSSKTFTFVLKAQARGTVSLEAKDVATNQWVEDSAKTSIIRVVDDKAPVVTIKLPDPVNSKDGKDYYDNDFVGTVTVDEANFYKEDMVVTIDGQQVPVTWIEHNGDVHVGTFPVSGEGQHKIVATHTDRSGNVGTATVNNVVIIDKTVPVITVTGVKHHSANNGDTVTVTISVTDANMSPEDFVALLQAMVREGSEPGAYTYKLKDIDLGDLTITQNGDLTTYSYTIENLTLDGYYKLTATASDLAGHTTNIISVERADEPTEEEKNKPITEVNFSVNREGSVFWVETRHNFQDDPNFIENKLNGAYVNGDVNIEIHEVNVDPVNTEDDLKTVLSLNNGSSTEKIDLQEVKNGVGNYVKNESLTSTGGWFESVYTLAKELFVEDGVYSFDLVTYDTAHNSNLEPADEESMIRFTLDRTDPVIVANVSTGQRINAQEYTVEITITEANLDPSTLRFYLDDQPVEVTDLGNNVFSFVADTGLNHKVTVEAGDLARNTAETLEINRLTISTNLLVLWYANTPLFIGSIVGVAGVTGGLIAFFMGKKKKKEQAYAA